MTAHPLTAETLSAHLDERLEEDGRAWLSQAVADVRADPAAIRRRFPAVSRSVGRGTLEPSADDADPFVVMVDDAARAALVVALGPADQASELPGLYQHGDPRERRGVLRSLDAMPAGSLAAGQALAGIARVLVDDALRTNDTRLVAAALGPAGVGLLDDEAFAQAVLKCVFVGVPLEGIASLADRVTPQLSRMMADFVHERIAAGRDVPASVWPVIDAHPPAEQLAAIEAELGHPVARRADAARAALAKRV